MTVTYFLDLCPLTIHSGLFYDGIRILNLQGMLGYSPHPTMMTDGWMCGSHFCYRVIYCCLSLYYVSLVGRQQLHLADTLSRAYLHGQNIEEPDVDRQILVVESIKILDQLLEEIATSNDHQFRVLHVNKHLLKL